MEQARRAPLRKDRGNCEDRWTCSRRNALSLSYSNLSVSSMKNDFVSYLYKQIRYLSTPGEMS